MTECQSDLLDRMVDALRTVSDVRDRISRTDAYIEHGVDLRHCTLDEIDRADQMAVSAELLRRLDGS